MHETQYNHAFFLAHQDGSSRSAALVVPLVLSQCPANSVVDVGCGLGTWASAFLQCGVEDVLGIDGDYINSELGRIPPECFLAHDLRLPISLNRHFELAVCLEVGEHLPPSRATGLVSDLVSLAPCVLFSAALPGQGGTGHINEQYLSHWAGLFAAHDYQPVDTLRPLIWDNPAIEWWYRQNLVFFVHREHPLAARSTPALDYIHPELFAIRRFAQPTLRMLLQAFPGALRRSLHIRAGRFLKLGSVARVRQLTL